MDTIAKEVIFHFNKAHLSDSKIPMWVLKTQGQTYYINHLDADCPWCTKETPDNPSTKGSLKFKNCHLIIYENGNATLKRTQ